jgi:large subunit ribosomal protein L32
MAVPKRRVSHRRKKLRQSHQALAVPGMSVDTKTRSVHRPHHVDLKTGMYRGKQILFKDDAPAAGGEAAGDQPKA